MFNQPLKLNDEILPISWKRSALDFISSLLNFDAKLRLGHLSVE